MKAPQRKQPAKSRKSTHPQRRTVQITMDDSSGGPEVYEPIAEKCHWCHAEGTVWRQRGTSDYRVCTSPTCGHGWSHESIMNNSSTEDDNPVIAQVVAQLRAPRSRRVARRAA